MMIAMLTLLAMQPEPPAPGAPALGEIRMQLLYTGSGRLSGDISPPRNFVGWNTIIGEGDADEPAEDLLVSVELRTSGEQHVAMPITLTAQDGRGRVIASRTSRSTLTSRDGRALVSLMLQDVGCCGRIRIIATMGRQSRAEEITLNCGE